MIDAPVGSRVVPTWNEVGRSDPPRSSRRVLWLSAPFALAGAAIAWTVAPMAALVAFVVGGTVVACFASAVERAIERVGRAVASGVGSVLLVPVGILGVVLPWLVRPLVGTDDLATSRSPSAWHRMRVRRIDPRRSWAVSRRWDDRSPATRWRRRILVLALAIGLVAAAASLNDRPDVARRRAYSLSEPTGVAAEEGIPAAFADAAWYPKYREDLEYAGTWLGGAQVIDNTALSDGRSTYLNVVDGHRASWAPPACSCRRVTVWVYGASTTFGIGQRDDHTIPSELARAAWADGYALDVVNRGVPGEEHWQEANRLRWDLTRHPAPDLVVFYDGASDIVGASWIEAHHLADPDQPVEPLTEGFLSSEPVVDAVRAAKTGGEAQPPLPEGMAPIPSVTVPTRTPAQVGLLAVQRYERSRAMSRDIAAANGLDVHWFWQPTRFSRSPVAGEPTTDEDARSRAVSDAARANLPAGVVDLSDALDGSEAPIFSDDVHHNELGARLIARAMYRNLRSSIASIADGGGGG